MPENLEFRQSFNQLLSKVQQLEEITRESAGYFAECIEHTTDRALLWMVTHKMVLGSRCLREFLENIKSFYDGREYWRKIDWDKLFGKSVFPPHGIDDVVNVGEAANSEPG